MEPLLEVKNLSTHFFTDDGLIRAVDGISYDIYGGETVGLVGESGCGRASAPCRFCALSRIRPEKSLTERSFFKVGTW